MHGLAVVKAPDAVGLPAAQEAVYHGIPTRAPLLASSEGELIDITDLEHLRDIPFGKRPLQVAVIGVSHLAEPAQPFRVGGD